MRLIRGDCLEIMPTLDADSIDSIVTDPPYGLSFMGKDWDHGVPGVEFWREALRVAKPGAHLLAFGGTRTFHRLAVAIEDAGWEIRDTLGWLHGSGFPKSLDVSKAIDKAAGAEREVVGVKRYPDDRERHTWSSSTDGRNNWGGNDNTGFVSRPASFDLTAPATPDAERWQGWGTALKPAWEPVILARKPLVGTVVVNVLAHGTGALNIDGCRVGTENLKGRTVHQSASQMFAPTHQRQQGYRPQWDRPEQDYQTKDAIGRWPANVLHDGSDDVTALFPETIGGVRDACRNVSIFGAGNGTNDGTRIDYDSGSAARFFYCAKASREDREAGCEDRPLLANGQQYGTIQDCPNPPQRNNHPTVKPTALMRYLCRLITPPGGIILDPFCGSGSTGKAAVLEGFDFIGIDTDADYLAIAEARIAAVSRQEALALA